VGEPGREFELAAIATRNFLLHGTMDSSIEAANSCIYGIGSHTFDQNVVACRVY
jgi:hypothetical protein